MRVAEVATRALLGATLALPQNAVTPNPSGLQVRQTGGCGTLEKACGTGCISTLSSCCDTQGGYCGVSQYCTDDGGCCDRGKVCTGPITCDAGQKLCGTKCAPAGSVCCAADGYYCPAGTTCTATNRCVAGSSSGAGSPGSSLSTCLVAVAAGVVAQLV